MEDEEEKGSAKDRFPLWGGIDSDCGQYQALSYLALLWVQVAWKSKGTRASPRSKYSSLLKLAVDECEKIADPGEIRPIISKYESSDSANRTNWLQEFAKGARPHPRDSTLLQGLFRVLLGQTDFTETWDANPTDASVAKETTDLSSRKRAQWKRALDTAQKIYDLKGAYRATMAGEDVVPHRFRSPSLDQAIMKISNDVFHFEDATYETAVKRFQARGSRKLSPVSFSCFRWDGRDTKKVTKTRLFIYPPDLESGNSYAHFMNITGGNGTRRRDTKGIVLPVTDSVTFLIGRTKVASNSSYLKVIAVNGFDDMAESASALVLTRGLEQDIIVASRLVMVRDVLTEPVPTIGQQPISQTLRADLGQADIEKLPHFLAGTVYAGVKGSDEEQKKVDDVVSRLSHGPRMSQIKELLEGLRDRKTKTGDREKLVAEITKAFEDIVYRGLELRWNG